MAEDDDSKTEAPTGKRLSQAEDEGDVIQSQEVKTAVMLVAMTVFVWLLAPLAINHLKIYLQQFLSQPDTIRVGTIDELQNLARNLAWNIIKAMVMPMGFLLLCGLAGAISQTGWLFVPNKLMPDLNKINPLTGLKRMFSLNALVDLLKSVVKMSIVAIVSFFLLRPRFKELELLPSMEMAAILTYLHQVLVRLLFAVVMIVIVIAVADYAYQRYQYLKKLRMTKQEVKEENKQSEGDPMIKSRLRALRMQRARSRMMASVPKADVVVTNPTHYACALKYDGDTMNAPTLVAKGQNLVAQRIREVATENDVPIVENPPLARALYATVDIDREIAPEHYKAVAEVISYVMRLKGKFRR